MAESVAELFQGKAAQQPGGVAPLIVHFNGAFHSDYRLGTAARVKQRLPKASIRVVTIIPVSDLDLLNSDEHRKRADFLIFTLQAPKPRPAAAATQ